MFTAALLLVALHTSPARAEVPDSDPPAGYQWADLPEIKGALLQPDGWFVHRGTDSGTIGVFISKEEIGPSGEPFTTGLTLNVTKEVKDPQEWSKAFVLEAARSYPFLRSWEHEAGPLKSVGFVYRDSKKPKLRVHNLVITNADTHTVYVIVFEAPNREWEDAWKIGEPMLKFLYFDQGF